MGTIQNFGTTQAKKMSKLERIPTQDFDRDVTATAMDDRFILVGQVDGKLHAVYHKNGVSAFSVKIAECEITAVCCEEQDETDNPIFYAGDVEGNLYTVNKKGKVLKTAKLEKRKGKIFTISNRNKYSIYAHTSGRETLPLPALTTPLMEMVPSTRKKELETTMSFSMIAGHHPNVLQLAQSSLGLKSRTMNKFMLMLSLMMSMQT